MLLYTQQYNNIHDDAHSVIDFFHNIFLASSRLRVTATALAGCRHTTHNILSVYNNAPVVGGR